jgi:hypothetical protein
MEKKDSEITAEEYAERKRRERLEQNRVSAMESRKRKKTMIEELQRSVIHLSKENKELNDRNDTLRRDLVDLGSKYPQILPLHTVMGIGFQVPENLNPGGYNPSAAPMSHLAPTTPGTSSMPPAPSSVSNPSDAMFQMNPALAAAFMAHQQGSGQMMNNNTSTVNHSSEQNGSSGKDEQSNSSGAPKN